MKTKSQTKNLFALSLIPTLLITTNQFAGAANNKKVGQSTKQSGPLSNQSETFRHSPPALPAPHPFKLMDIISYTLPNGLSVQLLPDHRVPLVTMQLGINAGASLEPKELLGLAGITANMITEGTNTHTSKEIANEIDFIGGALGATANHDSVIVSSSALSKYTPRLLNIFADVVLQPNFPEDELKLQKTNLIQELSIKRSEPDFLVDERFSKSTFGDHPYAVIAPTEKTVQTITKEDLQKFHNEHYLPNESYLVVVGDFDLEKMKSLIDEKFGQEWHKNSVATSSFPSAPKQEGRTIYLVDRPGSVQSTIKLGNISIKKTDTDYFPFLVANQILGGATNSRLFLNIREQKGYTYGAYSGVGARKEPGAFAAEAEVRTEVTAPSLQEFLYELERLRNIKVSDKELSQAKSYLAGSFQLGLETQSGLAGRLLERKLYNLPTDYLETYVSNVMAITADQIRDVARKHIDLDNLVICVVGDANKIKGDLQYFGNIDVYDMSGKAVGTATEIGSNLNTRKSLNATSAN